MSEDRRITTSSFIQVGPFLGCGVGPGSSRTVPMLVLVSLLQVSHLRGKLTGQQFLSAVSRISLPPSQHTSQSLAPYPERKCLDYV